MSASPFRRAAGLAVVGGLVTALLAGCAAAPAAGPLSGAASASLASSKHISCTGDAAAAKAAAKSVAYDSLPKGSSFTATLANAGSNIVKLRNGTMRVRDFNDSKALTDGVYVDSPLTGLIGSSAKRVTIEVKAHTSTRGFTIPTTFPNTNELNVMSINGTVKLLRSFTVQGTAQGHLYNGLRVNKVDGLRASYLRVFAIPGDDHQPPGETFGVDDYRGVGSHWSHIYIDGKNKSASGFAANGAKNIVLCDVTARRNSSGMGFAFWQTKNIRLVDCRASGSGFSGFNFERVTGTVTVIRADDRNNLKYGFRIASDRSSAKFKIEDPKLTDGHFTVSMPRRWYGTTNKQKESDITLTIHGKKRPDLLRFYRY